MRLKVFRFSTDFMTDLETCERLEKEVSDWLQTNQNEIFQITQNEQAGVLTICIFYRPAQ